MDSQDVFSMPQYRSYAHDRNVLWPLGRLAARLQRCERGSIFVIFALALPVLLALVGGTIEFARLSMLKAKLQSIADTAALSTARQFAVADSQTSELRAAADAYVQAHIGKFSKTVSTSINVNHDTRSVTVSLSLRPNPVFITPFAKATLKADATANVVGMARLCVLGLNEGSRRTISLNVNAKLTGNGCAVHSNSTSEAGMEVAAGANLVAATICSTGGGSGNYEPELMTDCPAIPDPLAARPVPESTTCTETNRTVGETSEFKTSLLGQAVMTGFEVLPELSGSTTETQDSTEPAPDSSDADRDEVVRLSPGVYCGGLLIGGNSHVEFEPGIYVMKDGPLHVDGTSRIEGNHVGFYFTGYKSTLYFGPKTSISLVAPKEGLLAGILLFEEYSSTAGRLFSILSDDARVLTGTIYLPKATLVIDADRPIADKSAYTAIVVSKLELFAGPHLVLNSNYNATEVPAPASVAGGDVRLVK